ncbi:MAG TPA: hypothetical protein ENF24_04050 [Methanosarcinales archaeon]|nr:hypothetical protein [Methanosarcinales archaeon]
MGFGISVATAIIAIGIILTATVHYERVSGSYESLRDATDAKQARMVSVLDTTIEIYNTSACLYEGKGKIDNMSPGNDYFYIKNAGVSSIDASELIVLVNGAIVSPSPTWSGWLYPGKTFNATLDLNNSDDVKIVTANGRSARAEVM